MSKIKCGVHFRVRSFLSVNFRRSSCKRNLSLKERILPKNLLFLQNRLFILSSFLFELYSNLVKINFIKTLTQVKLYYKRNMNQLLPHCSYNKVSIVKENSVQSACVKTATLSSSLLSYL